MTLRPDALPAFRPRRARQSGYSIADLLVGLGIIILLVAIVLPILVRARGAQKNINCLSNLRQIATGFLLYAENQGTFPNPSVTQIPWERSVSKFAPLTAFACPADNELAPQTGSSYDWRDIQSDPESNLAGRPLRDVQRGGVALVYEALGGWHANGTINAAFTDGSAQTMTEKACGIDITRPITRNGIAKP